MVCFPNIHRIQEINVYNICMGVLIFNDLEGRKEMFYLTTHSTHFIYSYMASDIYKKITQIARERKPVAATWATLSDYQQEFFYMHIPQTGGAGRSSEVERSLMVRWVVGSIHHGVDPLSYFSFQPVLHDCM